MTTHSARAPAQLPAALAAAAPVDVVLWRVRRLEDAGFPAPLARSLAGQRVDLHALLQLVDRGCPPRLAARILDPDDASAGRR